jgi:hypothetical protein
VEKQKEAIMPTKKKSPVKKAIIKRKAVKKALIKRAVVKSAIKKKAVKRAVVKKIAAKKVITKKTVAKTVVKKARSPAKSLAIKGEKRVQTYTSWKRDMAKKRGTAKKG